MTKFNIKLFIFSLFIILVYLYCFFDNPKENTLTGFLVVIPSLFATVMGGFLVFKYGIRSKTGISFLFVTFGLFCWFIGDFLWFIFDFILGIEPFPSVADVVYLIGYPLFFIGFLKVFLAQKSDHGKEKIILPLIISLLLLFLVGYFGIYQAYDSEASLWENLFGIFYGVGDAVLTIMLAFIITRGLSFKGGKFFLPWTYIFIGMLVTVVADITFAIYYDLYDSGGWLYSLLDLMWSLSYFLIGYGLFYTGKIIEEVHDKVKKQLNS